MVPLAIIIQELFCSIVTIFHPAQMSELQDFCLRWSSYTQQLSEALRTLLDRELLVDVTLACDGRSLRAHRAVLSACSTYFQVCVMVQLTCAVICSPFP